MNAEKPVPWTRPDVLPSGWTSERLVCRYCDPALAPAMFEAVQAKRDALLPWLEWAKSDNTTVQQCVYNLERFRRNAVDPLCTEYFLVISDRVSGEFVGGTGWHAICGDSAQAEFGYWIRGDRHGQGLCTEAMRAHLTWGFLPQDKGGWGFRRIEAWCAADNAASVRVLTKLGMRLESTKRAHRWIDGAGWRNSLGFALLADEWQTRSEK
ncbi:MAG: GNAT family N-acetyltransferase [Phycisphaeraceae bacterium]|nr:GNAT family N-acetyltransferase [Phycisphaerales bacterium]MCB9859672.1 GNAT family N-acetyltransferase [Phycisphaeraceae bacterium]